MIYIPNLQSYSVVIAALSLVIAATTFILGIIKFRADQHNEKVRSWQKVAIYSLIEKTGLAGIGFDEIRKNYITESIAVEGIRLEKKNLSDIELRRMLLELKQSGVVQHSAQEKYHALRYHSPEIEHLARQQQVVQFAVDNALINILFSEPYIYGVQELITKIHTTSGRSQSEIVPRIMLGLSAGQIIRRADHKLALLGADAAPKLKPVHDATTL